jgi:hypothetical protein
MAAGKTWFNYSIIPAAGERGRQVGREHNEDYRWRGGCAAAGTSHRSGKCLKSLGGTVQRQIDLKSGRIFETETESAIRVKDTAMISRSTILKLRFKALLYISMKRGGKLPLDTIFCKQCIQYFFKITIRQYILPFRWNIPIHQYVTRIRI